MGLTWGIMGVSMAGDDGHCAAYGEPRSRLVRPHCFLPKCGEGEHITSKRRERCKQWCKSRSVTFWQEPVFKIIRWKVPVVPTESTFMGVDSLDSFLWYSAVFIEKGRVFSPETGVYRIPIRGMDPRIRIWIYTTMSWIRNTAADWPWYLSRKGHFMVGWV